MNFRKELIKIIADIENGILAGGYQHENVTAQYKYDIGQLHALKNCLTIYDESVKSEE